MRILHLYRPHLPGQRAQAIQVVHACHALAARGHRVTLLADRSPDHAEPTPAAALALLGLAPVEGLDLRLAPLVWKGGAGLWFRAQALAWATGAPGVVLARDKGRLRWLLQATGGLRRHRVVLESHEVDSMLAEEAGRDPAPIRALESTVLSRADALVTNCGGTLACWEEAWGAALPPRRRAVHNAVSPDRRRGHREPEAVLRCVGSLRAYKGVAALAQAADALPLRLELIGGSPDEQAALGTLPTGVRLRPPVPYPEVPDLLARSAALVLPLADNLFGRRLTSPLKLWDYLATAVPIVAPDLPSVREIAEETGVVVHTFAIGDGAALLAAVARALSAPPRAPFVRTWAQRAVELEPLLSGEEDG